MGEISKRGRRLGALWLGASAVVALSVATAVPAEAASNTWLNQNTSSNTIYVEPDNSWSLSRTGVESLLKGADGTNFQTTLWLGATSTQGTNRASLSSSLSKLRSKFRWRYLPSGSQFAYIDATVTITGVPGGPMGRVASAGPAVELPATVDLASIGKGAIDPASVKQVGVSGNTVFYSAESVDSVYLIATLGDFAASTAATKSDVAARGLTLRVDSDGESAQGALVPSTVSDTALAAAGLTEAGEGFFVDTRAASRTTTTAGVGSVSAKAVARAAAPAGIVLYGAPTE